MSFSLIELLNLIALSLSFLIVVYLLFVSRFRWVTIVPMLYFITLSAGFLDHALPVITTHYQYSWYEFMLSLLDTLMPAMSFLLILQFLLNRTPPAPYWLVIAIPTMGSSVFVYLKVFSEEICISKYACFTSSYAYHMNDMIFTALIFMLTVITLSRVRAHVTGTAEVKHHKYWLIIALILLNLTLVGLELVFVRGLIFENSYLFANIMLKICFIYLVAASVFKVFSVTFEPGLRPYSRAPLSKKEKRIAEEIKTTLAKEKPYHDMHFNRRSLAKYMGLKEHQLSRIINLCFNKSVSEFTNEFRIEDAKEKLKTSRDPITAISYDVGFSSIASFNRVFKDLTGISPSKFRQQKNESA